MDVMSINIHRMFEYLFCADESSSFLNLRFENDVEMYGTQTVPVIIGVGGFENDVEIYNSKRRGVRMMIDVIIIIADLAVIIVNATLIVYILKKKGKSLRNK